MKVFSPLSFSGALHYSKIIILMFSLIFRGLILPMALAFPVLAQTGQQASAPTVETLKIRILEGAGAVHNIATGIAGPLVVEVRNANEAPVEDAAVTFELPVSGPGGLFGDGKTSHSAKTNFQGQATWQGFQPNKQEGSFQVKVTVLMGQQSGRISVRQSNSLRDFAADQSKKKGWFTKKKVLILAAAAGGGVGAWLALRGGPTSITLSTGPIVFGPPR